MHRSRYVLLTLLLVTLPIGIVALSISVGELTRSPKPSKSENQMEKTTNLQSASKQQEKQSPKNQTEMPEVIQTRKDEVRSTEEKQNNHQNMSTYERWSLIAQFGIVAVTLIYALFAYLQWQAIKQQSNFALQTLTLSQRPWVTADTEIIRSFIFTPSGARITPRFTLKNIGNSPARDIIITVHMFPHITRDNTIAEQDAIRSHIWRPDSSVKGDILFPGDKIQRDILLTMNQGDIKEALEQFPSLRPIITGCIDYRFEFSEEYHQTGFTFELFRANQAGATFVIEPTIGTIPATCLRLGPSPHGGRYAN